MKYFFILALIVGCSEPADTKKYPKVSVTEFQAKEESVFTLSYRKICLNDTCYCDTGGYNNNIQVPCNFVDEVEKETKKINK